MVLYGIIVLNATCYVKPSLIPNYLGSTVYQVDHQQNRRL